MASRPPAMSSNNQTGKPDDERFLPSPTSPTDSHPPPPAVTPLRIVKRETSSSPAPAGSGSRGRAPSSSSSPNPLPYPDNPPSSRQAREPSRPQYPDNARRPSGAGVTSPTSAPSSASDVPASLRPRDRPRRNSPPAQQPTLAQRRGAAPKPLSEPTSPESSDSRGLVQQAPRREEAAPAAQRAKGSTSVNSYPEFHQQSWAVSTTSSSMREATETASRSHLQVGNPSSINRLSSTASTSTTKAQRGSPPPPETPVAGPGQQPASDIEARYAASGIAGTATLNNIHAQSAAAHQRMQQQYAHAARQSQHQQPQPPRPWTPTEQPGTQPHGPPRVYQGVNEVGVVGQPAPGHHYQQMVPGQTQHAHQLPHGNHPTNNGFVEDFQRMTLTSSPPPAYSSVAGSLRQGYAPEKQGAGPQASIGAMVSGAAVSAVPGTSTPAPSTLAHPAFANDQLRQQHNNSAVAQQNGHGHGNQLQAGFVPEPQATPGPAPASPPPLPEGWIAHLDPNSGQYYYIHLPTQSTQWEFPKGPTPLNLAEAPMSPGQSNFAQPLLSPALSTFGKPQPSPGLSAFGQPIPSPGLPMTPGYDTFNIAPPPASGVELYKVQPTNGVYFGPYLRYKNIDMERGLWLGSILLVTDAPQPPTIHIHQSIDLSPNPRQLTPVSIAAHQRWTFYKYEIDLQMEESGPARWTYAITSHLGCTRYEFLVAGRHETNWRFITTSGNDFSPTVNANDRAKLGGVAYMWKDILQKHAECGGFHAHLGLGGQINADRMWRELPSLKQWLAMSGKEARKNAPWSAALEEEVTHAYFHYYTSHFDQPHLREAFAQIPHILQVDDHDLFDGFGSYPDHMQFSNMFKNIGRIGIEMYLLFQHHTTLEILRHVNDDLDLFTITGTGWHFLKFLGPAIAVVGVDCRSERNPHQVLAGPTYQGIFPKVAMLPPSVQHCIWMLPVPIVYPRMDSAEQLVQTMATGKKAVTGAYNVLGKVTSSVAGVVGAKGAVGSGFDSVKRKVGKTGLMGNILSPFGDIDFLDELKDLWTHESKDLERTYLIRTLQGIAHQRSIRMSFFSGNVSCCGAGMLHDPSHPTDHKTMYQIISSPVVNGPPPSYILRLLNGSSNKPLYIPANGQRSTPSTPTDTKEDMLELFQTDVAGQPREQKRLMARRNYVAVVAYDPDAVNAGYSGRATPGLPGHGGSGGLAPGGFPKVSLAVDFLVQGEGMYGSVVKYGPVIIPSLELGR
ncbi:hypothetical protein VTO42DRAFT_333 [Malbranchea cinnamomea]